MAEQKVGIIRAIFRYFRFWNWRKARYIMQAADEQFTGSVDGIDAAFEMHRDTMVERFTGLRDAIAEVEAVLEEKRAASRSSTRRKTELIRKREGRADPGRAGQGGGRRPRRIRQARRGLRALPRADRGDRGRPRSASVPRSRRPPAPWTATCCSSTEMQAEIEKSAAAEGRSDGRLRLRQADHRAQRPAPGPRDLDRPRADLRGDRRQPQAHRQGPDHRETGRRRRPRPGQGLRAAPAASPPPSSKMDEMLAARVAEKEAPEEAEEEEKKVDTAAGDLKNPPRERHSGTACRRRSEPAQTGRRRRSGPSKDARGRHARTVDSPGRIGFLPGESTQSRRQPCDKPYKNPHRRHPGDHPHPRLRRQPPWRQGEVHRRLVDLRRLDALGVRRRLGILAEVGRRSTTSRSS